MIKTHDAMEYEGVARFRIQDIYFVNISSCRMTKYESPNAQFALS